MPEIAIQKRARAVIIGAGIAGCSVAYHLTKLGWRDLVVVEQGPLFETGGSTSHAPGLVFQINPSKTLTAFAKDTVQLWSGMELDGAPCARTVGESGGGMDAGASHRPEAPSRVRLELGRRGPTCSAPPRRAACSPCCPTASWARYTFPPTFKLGRPDRRQRWRVRRSATVQRFTAASRSPASACTTVG